MKIKHLLAYSLAASLFSSASFAQSVTTDPVGVVTQTIYGENTTFIGVGLHEAEVFRGTISAIDGTELSVNVANLSELVDSGRHYAAEITSSSGLGIINGITSFSSGSFVTAQDLSSIVSVGEAVIVRAVPTVSEIFGSGDDLVLASGTAAVADLVIIPDPTGSGTISLYYSAGGILGSGWRRIGSGNTNFANTPVYPGDGIRVLKRSIGNVELSLVGSVRPNPLTVVIDQGFTPFATSFPAGTTLASSGLYNADNPSLGLTAGTAATADLIYLDPDGSGTVGVYYYSAGGILGQGWRRVGAGNADQSSVAIDRGFGVLKRGADSKQVTFASPISF